MLSPKELSADLKVLLALARGQPRRSSHAERLERFYAGQAHHYDGFRERLLHGRRELIAQLDLHSDARVAEIGAGTGRTAEFFGKRLAGLGQLDLVDVCPSLLARARDRFRASPNVRIIEADALAYRPATALDCVYFSYSLSMMPDWRATLRHALSLLAPRGILAVVDFGLPPDNGWLERSFWKAWFSHDGVRLHAEHVPALLSATRRQTLRWDGRGVPYLPLLKPPFYTFVGHKPGAA